MSKNNGKLRSLIGKVKDVALDVTYHWKKPARGKFVSYGEILNYSIGGMGIQCIMYVMSFMALGAGNTLIGSTIGIRPMHLQYMASIMGILGLAFPIIRGKMVDNTRTKYGRFRPYLALSGLPLLIICIIFIYLPFETMVYKDKLIATMCMTIAISFVSPLFTDTYGELGSCLTPNSAERTNIFAISSIIYSFAPTVYYTLVPILSNLTGGFTDIRTYKYIVIPVGIIGVALSLFTAFGCKERVVTSKNYVQKVGIIEGCKAIYQNKYWWIRVIAGLVGFLEMASAVIFGWIYIYGTQDMITFGILNTVWGTASGLSMFCTPYILKKLGNRRTLLFHNSLNIVFTIFMLFTFKLPGVYFIFMYINTFINQLQIVYNPVLAAEVKDSIQYQSGKRMDFTLGAAWILIVPIQIVTGFVLPFIYETMGLTVNYDVLYDPIIRNGLFYVLCVCSIIGAALNLIPFFFYNLSREKHQMIILSLRYRAANSDYSLGQLNCHQIREVVEMYNKAMEIKNAEPVNVKECKKAYLALLKEKAVTEEMKNSEDYKDSIKRKEMIKQAKIDLKARRKAAFKAYTDADTLMNNKEAYEDIFAKELVKFTLPLNVVKYNVYSKIKNMDLNDIKNNNLDLSDITWNKEDEKLNKQINKFLKTIKKQYAKMQAKANKYYSEVSVVNNYWDELQKAIDTPAETNEEKKAHDKNVREKEKAFKLFNKVYECFNKAEDFVNQKDNSDNFEKYIVSMYEEAVIQSDEENRIQDEKDQKERDDHKKEIERIRLEKKNKKLIRKGFPPIEIKEEEEIKEQEKEENRNEEN